MRNVGVILRGHMSLEALTVLDEVAAAAGKSRDEFAFDYLQEMAKLERSVRDRNEPGGSAA